MSDDEVQSRDDSQIHPFVRELVIGMMEPKGFRSIYRMPKDIAGFEVPFPLVDSL